MNPRTKNQWAAEFENVRRQRGRGHGHHPGGPGWGGPMGGPPPWVGQMFGPQWGGTQSGRGRRTPVRRGDVRSAILEVLSTSAEPINGYQVIQKIAERTQDAWKPSPGSIYPTLAQLQDEGLVEDGAVGRKTVQLSTTGRAYVTENAAEIASVWKSFDAEDGDDGVGVANLKQVIKQTVGAIVQVASTGTPAQQARAAEILADTRRRLYGLLAEGPEAAEEE